MINQQVKEAIITFLIQKLSPTTIYLFGSQATGNTHTDSDFDIAYLANNSINHYERFMLA